LKNKALKQISVTPDAMSQRRRFALRPLRGHKEFLRVLKLLLHNPEIFSAKQDLSGCQAELWNRSLKLKSAHHNIKRRNWLGVRKSIADAGRRCRCWVEEPTPWPLRRWGGKACGCDRI